MSGQNRNRYGDAGGSSQSSGSSRVIKYPVGTATASQILRGSMFINVYFE